jgi:hypothetical protein
MAATQNVLIDPFITPDPADVNDPQQIVFVPDLRFCNVTFAEDLFKPSPFEAPQRLEKTNTRAIRFGASNDMMSLLSGTDSEQSDYLWGLVGTSFVFALIVLCWSLLILFFMCTGYRRAGFLSGRFVRPKQPEEEFTSDLRLEEATTSEEKKTEDFIEGDLKEKEDNTEKTSNNAEKSINWAAFCQRQEKRLFRTRIVAAFSTVCVIVSCILFCVYGTKYVDHSITDIRAGLTHVKKLCGGGIIVIDNFIVRAQEVKTTTEQDFSSVNGICPVQSICQNVDPPQNCDFSPIPIVLRNQFEEFFNLFFQGSAYLYEEISSLKIDLQELIDVSQVVALC